MSIEYDQQELLNEYIARQNRKISELSSQNIMLETRLAMAEKKIIELVGNDEEVMDAGTFGPEAEPEQNKEE
jgi:hypothetical protein